jgi:hypothetical protein
MFAHELSDICKFDQTCRTELCSYKHREKIDKSKNKDAGDINVTNGDESDKVNTEDNLDIDKSDIEDDDETEIIYQRFLKNYKRRENEDKNKTNGEKSCCANAAI